MCEQVDFLPWVGNSYANFVKTELQIVSTVNHFPCKMMTFMVMLSLSGIVFKHIQCISGVFFNSTAK